VRSSRTAAKVVIVPDADVKAQLKVKCVELASYPKWPEKIAAIKTGIDDYLANVAMALSVDPVKRPEEGAGQDAIPVGAPWRT